MVDQEAYIDLIFRNGLKDFEILPPSDVWENIKPVIKRKQRPYVFLRVAAITVVLLSLGVISFLLTRNLSVKYSSPSISINNDAIPKGNYVANAEHIQAVIHDVSTDLSALNVSEARNPKMSSEAVSYDLSDNGYSETSLINSSSQKNIFNNPLNNLIINRSSGPVVSGTGFMKNIPVATKSENKVSRWSIGALASPTYFSSFDIGSNAGSKDLNKSEKAAVSYSGGVVLYYKINKKISVQTGLYYSSLGQKVTGISSFAGFNSYNETKAGSNFSVRTSSGTITSTNNDIFLIDSKTDSRVITRYSINVFDPVKANLQYLDNSILQNFNYLEIPFLFKYNLIDRKVDFNIFGGISYNLLINNSAYSVSGGEKYFIGKTDGLSPVTFSSSLGMGMEYNLSSKISLNLEPTFRYYITPLNGLAGSSVHPYSFGILSGFSYKF